MHPRSRRSGDSRGVTIPPDHGSRWATSLRYCLAVSMDTRSLPHYTASAAAQPLCYPQVAKAIVERLCVIT
jgi:hypothetical protein